MSHSGPWLAALALALVLSGSNPLAAATATAKEPLVCPLEIAPATLTMACSAVCPHTFSPCLYYAKASDCVAEEDSGSECVASSSSSSESGCAVECFYPYNADGTTTSASSDWNLMITDVNEYKRDVLARKARDPSFPLAKKSATQLATIGELSFPSTVSTISITGNALPIVDKALDYTVVHQGDVVTVAMASDGAFLSNAVDATTIILENLLLTGLTSFPLLPKLTTLHLANGKLQAVPSGIAALPGIQRLDLSLNSLATIAKGTLPTTLTDLCLQDCALEEIPSDLLLMPNLKKLDLAGNKFPVPGAGVLPLQLEQLIWWGLYHKQLPADIASMNQLKKLDLGSNDFSEPTALDTLPVSLEELQLANAMLHQVPVSFTRLTKLTKLTLAGNALSSVTPRTIPLSLTFLNLSSNTISYIEDNALPMELTALDLRWNRLASWSFPSDFGSATLPKLTTLYLHANQLDTLPSGLFTLKTLQVLSLHRNPSMRGLTVNETELSFLSNLQKFSIDKKSLETNCDSPQPIGTFNYKVCLTGDPSIKATTEEPATTTRPLTGDDGPEPTPEKTRSAKEKRNRTMWLILGTTIGVLTAIALLMVAVHLLARRSALADTAEALLIMRPPAAAGRDTRSDDPTCRDTTASTVTCVSSDGGGYGGERPTRTSLSTSSELSMAMVEQERHENDGASDVTAYQAMTEDTQTALVRGTSTSSSSSSSLAGAVAVTTEEGSSTTTTATGKKITKKTTTKTTTSTTSQRTSASGAAASATATTTAASSATNVEKDFSF